MDISATQVFSLRKVGNSMYLRVPSEFVQANSLRVGDFLVLDLKQVGIVRQADFLTFAKLAPKLADPEQEQQPQEAVG